MKYWRKVVCYVACGLALGGVAAQNPIAGTIVTVETAQSPNEATVGGVVVSSKEVIFSAQGSGRVIALAGREGMSFPRGTILVTLNDDELRAQLFSAQADFARAQAALNDAQIQYERQLYSPQPTTFAEQVMGPFGSFFTERNQYTRRAELSMMLSQIEAARSNVAQISARIGEIQSALRDRRSIAPFDGVILERFVEQGDTVQPGQALLKFGDATWLQISADISVRLSAQLQPGQFVKVRLGDREKTVVPIRVAQIFPSADPTRQTVTVKFDLPKDTPAKVGMFVEVLVEYQDLAMENKNVLIPKKAVIYQGGLPTVRVVSADDKVELRLLRLGRSQADQVEVLSGLRAGEKIIVPEN
jgi:multidrug efflux pump subunit AcrA (membrane-fusion protein)